MGDGIADPGPDRPAWAMPVNTPHGTAPSRDNAADTVSLDHLLGRRVRYAQPRDGLRASLDPVLLAAAIPARAGERVLEGGTGAGAGMLCLAARVAGIEGLGIDRDPGLVRLARANAVANGWPDLLFAAGDLAASPIGGTFDHAFANPPYHADGGTPSASGAREAAKRTVPGLLPVWIEALSRPLRHRGTLTFILPARWLEEALGAMRAADVPAETIIPIWPKPGRPARFIVMQGRKSGRTPLTLRPGLVLHTQAGAFGPEAEAILRDCAPLFSL
jgi:tRNA1Val (adenine37-N6)-methyltransferase